MLKTVHQKLLHHTRPLLAWLKLLWRRIDEDHMTTLAGNLAYVSLLSLVPLIAVVFALFAAFPMFSEVSVQIRHFIFANFIPRSAAARTSGYSSGQNVVCRRLVLESTTTRCPWARSLCMMVITSGRSATNTACQP